MFENMRRLIAKTEHRIVGDEAALFDLDRRIQDAMRAHVEARRALALAIAAGERETRNQGSISKRAADLEERAIAALQGGRDDLARSAADAIAVLETEQQAAMEADALYSAEIARLRANVDAQRRRLADLARGRRLAQVRSALGNAKLRYNTDGDELIGAEQALLRLNDRQSDDAAVAASLAPPDDRLIETMADAGFGKPLHVQSNQVLERLRAKALLSGPKTIDN